MSQGRLQERLGDYSAMIGRVIHTSEVSGNDVKLWTWEAQIPVPPPFPILDQFLIYHSLLLRLLRR